MTTTTPATPPTAIPAAAPQEQPGETTDGDDSNPRRRGSGAGDQPATAPRKKTQGTPTRRRPRRRERIAMVSTHGYVASDPPLGAPDTGGQVVYVLELSRKLAQLGYIVDIWTRRFEDQPTEERVDERVRILRVPCGGDDFLPKEHLHRQLPPWIERALRLIDRKKLRYSFVNSHYWDGGIAGQALADALGTFHIHTPHSLGLWKQREMERDFPDSSEELDRTYNLTTRIQQENILYRECDLLVATSPQQMDLLKAADGYEVPARKIQMIPPGYDDTRFYPVGEASRQALRQERGVSGPTVASIGRLSRNKGFDLLVDAFAVVAERVPGARLRLAVGSEDESGTEDPMREQLEQQVVELGLGDAVELTGSLPDEEMADYYRAADVFVLPSRYEPFGMTAVEAMAVGTPVVLTTRGGLYRTTTFGHDALFADPFDRYDLGTAIARLLRHPNIRERLSINGAHKARSLFTWTGIAQQLVGAVAQRSLAHVEVFDES